MKQKRHPKYQVEHNGIDLGFYEHDEEVEILTYFITLDENPNWTP